MMKKAHVSLTSCATGAVHPAVRWRGLTPLPFVCAAVFRGWTVLFLIFHIATFMGRDVWEFDSDTIKTTLVRRWRLTLDERLAKRRG